MTSCGRAKIVVADRLEFRGEFRLEVFNNLLMFSVHRQIRVLRCSYLTSAQLFQQSRRRNDGNTEEEQRTDHHRKPHEPTGTQWFWQ